MIQASQFSNRETLETHVQALDMSTILVEDRVISGTIDELKQLFLSHGQNVYDFKVIASDYQVRDVAPFQKRGEATSRLDGRAIRIKI